MNKEIKLRNVIFPVWMLIFWPMSWLFVLPANFIIDSLVLLIAMKVMKIEDKKDIYNKSILKVWIFGFLSDFICGAILLVNLFIENDWWYNNVSKAVMLNPFSTLFGFIYVLIAVLVGGLFIYLFNYKFAFRNIDLPIEKIKKIALTLAIVTAPYAAFLPTALFYKG